VLLVGFIIRIYCVNQRYQRVSKLCLFIFCSPCS